jgi:hypothetical protein
VRLGRRPVAQHWGSSLDGGERRREEVIMRERIGAAVLAAMLFVQVGCYEIVAASDDPALWPYVTDGYYYDTIETQDWSCCDSYSYETEVYPVDWAEEVYWVEDDGWYYDEYYDEWYWYDEYYEEWYWYDDYYDEWYYYDEYDDEWYYDYYGWP